MKTINLIVLGMAGSGKTTFVEKLESENIPLINKNKENFKLKDVNNFISERDYKIGSQNLLEKEKQKK